MAEPGRSALVTGGAGFIGSRIATRLVEDGWRVRIIDAFTDYYDPALKRTRAGALAAQGVEVVDGDLNDLDLPAELAEIDVVFHTAGQPGVRKSWGSEFGVYTHANINATQRLLEASRGARLSRFVYSSSSSIYGDAESFPTLESATPKPVSPYGVTKLGGEHLSYLYGRGFDVPTVMLRYFTVYGPGQRPDMGFTRFLTAAVTDSEIEIYGTGEQVRDFTFVDDVVAANLAVATAEIPPGTVFNVAGGSSASVNEVLAIIEQIHGAPLHIVYRPPADGDVFRTGGSTAAIRSATGWQASVELADGLRRQYEWIVESQVNRVAG